MTTGTFPQWKALAGLAAVLVVAACGSDVSTEAPTPETLAPVAEAEAASSLAEAYCKVLFSCACETLDYPSEAACREAVQQTLDGRYATAKQHNLTYDGDCVAHQVRAVETLGCKGYSLTLDESTWGCEELNCHAYHGEIAEEQYCGYENGRFSDCVQGSSCNQGEGGDGACHPDCLPSNPVADGEVCYSDAVSAACKDGSYCESTSSGLCKAKPPAGELCGEWTFCAEGAYCDGSDATAKCQARLDDGASCTNGQQCKSRGCNSGVCGEETAYFCIVDL